MALREDCTCCTPTCPNCHADRERETGDGSKKDAGKLRYDLIPVGPLRELARVYTIGAAKYAPRGWESGMDWSRIISAMQRHVEAWRDGETHDPVDGQHHLSSVAWCAFALMEYERTHPTLDDRPATSQASPACHTEGAF